MWPFRPRRKRRKYQVRKSTAADVDFILLLIGEGYDAGHFGRGYIKKELLDSQKGNILTSLHGGFVYKPLENGLMEAHELSMYTLYVDDYGCAGCALLLTPVNGEDRTSELLILSVHSDLRGKGLGKIFTSDLVDGFTKSVNLTARCYKQSAAMCRILESLGFKLTFVSPTGTNHYRINRI